MKKLLIPYLIFILLLNLHVVLAGNEIIGYMAETIYNDCEGRDIDVRPLGLINTKTNEPVPVIKGDYKLNDILEIVNLIIEHEPYSVYVGGGDGQTLLSCNGKNLTVNFYTYKWKGQRLDPFIYNTNQITNQVINQIAHMEGSYKSQLIQSVGSSNFNKNKQYNLFSDNNFYLTIGLSLLSITLLEIGLWIYKRKKRGKKRNLNEPNNNPHPRI